MRLKIQRKTGLWPYTKPTSPISRATKYITTVFVGALVGAFFGAWFGLFSGFLITVPVAILGVMIGIILWVMPSYGPPPMRLGRILFYTFIVCLFLWPSYLAISIPGVAWVSITRIILFLLGAVTLYSLSISADTRRNLTEKIRQLPQIKILFLFFLLLLLSITYASDSVFALKKFSNFQLFWGIAFVAAFVYIEKADDARRILVLVAVLGIAEISLGLWEFVREGQPWANLVPQSLIDSDPKYLSRIMFAGTRAGHYRAMGTTPHPLIFSELAVISFVVSVFLVLEFHQIRVKIIGLVYALLFPFAIYISDSRSGAIGGAFALMFAVFLWALRRTKDRPRGIFRPALLTLYPFGLVTFVIIALFHPRGQTIFVGRGAVALDSTQGRIDQWVMAIEKAISSPFWGYGLGSSGAELGYVTPGGTTTVDSYYIVLLLDSGLFGLICFLLFFFLVFKKHLVDYLSAEPRALIFSGVIAVLLPTFLIIKMVLAQPENHTIIFLLIGVGMASYLLPPTDQAKKALLPSN